MTEQEKKDLIKLTAVLWLLAYMILVVIGETATGSPVDQQVDPQVSACEQQGGLWSRRTQMCVLECRK